MNKKSGSSKASADKLGKNIRRKTRQTYSAVLSNECEPVSVCQREVEYGGERYGTRDNGAVHRLNPYRKKARPLDKTWTFGRQRRSSGYMHISGVPAHRIVCSAFSGAPPDAGYVVDHIDTNRANNRPENLHWVTKLETSCSTQSR